MQRESQMWIIHHQCWTTNAQEAYSNSHTTQKLIELGERGRGGGGVTLRGVNELGGEETDVTVKVAHHGSYGDFSYAGFSRGVFLCLPNAICQIIPGMELELIRLDRMHLLVFLVSTSSIRWINVIKLFLPRS